MHEAAIKTIHVSYLWLMPAMPLLGFLINGILGKKLEQKLGRWVVHSTAIGAVAVSFVVACITFASNIAHPHAVLVTRLWDWIAFPGAAHTLHVDLAFASDRLTSVMLMVVTGVGLLIHIFSTGYMASEDHYGYWRFFAFMNLFMFAMLTLVLGDSILLMFVGWEGVGLCSYLLIGYYYQDREKAAAGMKAFVVNRIGDFGFIVGFSLLLWSLVGTWDQVSGLYHYQAAFSPTLTFRNIDALMADATFRNAFLAKHVLGVPVVTLIGILLFVGATGKSAQIPLYVWLPDAMAGPTPVSALIHAATMVTAGVYMIARLNFIYAYSPAAMTVVAVVGGLTALYAATIGLFQTDIKKVLAYSTISQLGYMFIGVGVGAFSAGIMHLMTHAFFKATLFLGAGSVIIGMHHRQDMKDLGGLKGLMKSTFWTFLFATFAISGIPGTAGFFSKDEILWKAFDTNNLLIPGWIVWLLGFIGAGFTVFYMFRLVFQTFYGEPRADEHTLEHVHEDWRMTSVLWVLGILSLIGGYVGVSKSLGGSNRFEHYLEPVFERSAAQIHFLSEEGGHGFMHSMGGEYTLMGLTLLLIAVAIWLAWKIYYNKYRTPEQEAEMYGKGLHRLVFNKYYIDEIYFKFVVNPLLAFTRACKWFDHWVVDGAVNGAAWLTKFFAWLDGGIDAVFVDGLVNLSAHATLGLGRQFRKLQAGRIQQYIVVLATGLSILVIVAFLLK